MFSMLYSCGRLSGPTYVALFLSLGLFSFGLFRGTQMGHALVLVIALQKLISTSFHPISFRKGTVEISLPGKF